MTGAGRSKPKLPPPPAPTPTPTQIDEQALEAGESLRRLQAKRKGRRSTILNEAVAPERATLLGNVGT